MGGRRSLLRVCDGECSEHRIYSTLKNRGNDSVLRKLWGIVWPLARTADSSSHHGGASARNSGMGFNSRLLADTGRTVPASLVIWSFISWWSWWPSNSGCDRPVTCDGRCKAVEAWQSERHSNDILHLWVVLKYCETLESVSARSRYSSTREHVRVRPNRFEMADNA
jgi:hypothetical protein